MPGYFLLPEDRSGCPVLTADGEFFAAPACPEGLEKSGKALTAIVEQSIITGLLISMS